MVSDTNGNRQEGTGTVTYIAGLLDTFNIGGVYYEYDSLGIGAVLRPKSTELRNARFALGLERGNIFFRA